MNYIMGIGAGDAAILVARVLLGAFFILARFRFFYDPSKAAGDKWCNRTRQNNFAAKLAYCGCTKAPTVWAWIAAGVEVLAGFGLIFGLLTIPSAFGLLVVLLVATRCTWKTKILEQHPVDRIDWAACYLWRVEGIYIGLALMILFAGPGKYSLDYMVLS